MVVRRGVGGGVNRLFKRGMELKRDGVVVGGVVGRWKRVLSFEWSLVMVLGGSWEIEVLMNLFIW